MNECIYEIYQNDKNENCVREKETWRHYLKYNYKIIQGWAYYKLVCLLADSIYYYHTETSEWNKESMNNRIKVEFQSILKRLRITLLEFLEDCDLEEGFKKLLIKRIEETG